MGGVHFFKESVKSTTSYLYSLNLLVGTLHSPKPTNDRVSGHSPESGLRLKWGRIQTSSRRQKMSAFYLQSEHISTILFTLSGNCQSEN